MGKVTLRSEHLKHLSDILGVPYESILRMYSLNLLDHKSIFCFLVQYDWTYFLGLKTNDRGLKKTELLIKLSAELKISETNIRKMLFEDTNGKVKCFRCGKVLTTREIYNNVNLCDHCKRKSKKE